MNDLTNTDLFHRIKSLSQSADTIAEIEVAILVCIVILIVATVWVYKDLKGELEKFNSSYLDTLNQMKETNKELASYQKKLTEILREIQLEHKDQNAVLGLMNQSIKPNQSSSKSNPT